MRPHMLIILSLGFVSGLPLPLIMGTLSVWLAEEGISNTSIGLFAAVGLPYAFKFIWSPVLDHLNAPPPFSYLGRRRGWLLCIQGCLIAAIVALGYTHPEFHPGWTAFCAFLVACCSATQDIIVDAYRVEILKEREQAAGAVAGVFGYRVGMLVSGAGGLALAYYTGWEHVYMVMALCILPGVVAVFCAREPDAPMEVGLPAPMAESRLRNILQKTVLQPGRAFMKHASWKAVLVFVVCYKLGDAFAAIMTNPFFVSLGFTSLQIGLIGKTFGFAAVIMGGMLGSVVVHYLGMFRALLVCGVLQLCSNGMFIVLALSGHNLAVLASVVAVENMASGMGTAAFVAYISMLCDLRYTATQYACLSALASVGRTVLGMFSGIVADQLGWIGFFGVSMLMALPGLVILRYLMQQPSNKGKIHADWRSEGN